MSYTYKCLYVDLTRQTYEVRDSDRQLFRDYVGGKGVGFALLEKLAPNPDPLGPENPLIFSNGPFTGTKVQTSARTALVTRSPLTGSILDTHCGGYFGPRLKAAGFDYVVITGISQVPVYLYIKDEKAEILDASDLWGKGAFFTNDELQKRHPGIEPRVAAIGQAGENLSKMACISVDKHRQYGRGGAGAVMGSKNLKAIVADGNTPITYADPAAFEELNKAATKDVLNNAGVKFRRVKGTMKCIRSGQGYEFLPVKNFQQVVSDRFEEISSETAREVLNWKDTACFGCSIRCSKFARWDGHEIEGPEYETTAFLGSGCLVFNIKDVAWANELCNDLGLDTISTGVTMSFAMECYEKGLIDDWDGLKLEWGNAEAQREMILRMAMKSGIGKLFSDGSRIAARRIGKNSSDFAINIYGMEMSGVNPKGCLTMGVVLSVADFASHTRLWMTEQEMGPDFTIDDIPESVASGLDEINARNCLVVCDFLPLGLNRLAPLLNAATGLDHTEESLRELGAKLTHLARRYNIRNGRKYTDDRMPERFFQEEMLAGFMRGKKVEKEFFTNLIRKYYKVRNWSEQGEPTPAVLEKYNLA
ncbi:MAG TPA: aldehyde ferredoxin oxidoreductase family protein [Bacteroidales bacterium]|nr:aldehyde ferredoxin oxidoreductase family protein [Bacteroidales bacterium]